MPIGVGTTVSYGGNSSFIGEKLQFHREETPVPSLWETFPIRMKLWSDGGGQHFLTDETPLIHVKSKDIK